MCLAPYEKGVSAECQAMEYDRKSRLSLREAVLCGRLPSTPCSTNVIGDALVLPKCSLLRRVLFRRRRSA